MVLGPASTVVDHLPINPAIRVHFLPEADDTSFVVAKMRDIDLSNYSSAKKSESAIYRIKEKAVFTLSLCVKKET